MFCGRHLLSLQLPTGKLQPALFAAILVFFTLFLDWIQPPVSQAWTESTVTGVSADLTVHHAGELTVVLSTHLQVRAGWLSTLELVGLDSDLVLSETNPPLLHSASGETYVPEVEIPQGGTVQLTFPRKQRAPRRGNYTLVLTYNTRQPFRRASAEREAYTRLRWRLPAWENGLENVVVQVAAPRGTLPLPPEAPDAQLDVALQAAGASTLLRFHRAKLPRMTPLDLTWDVPNASLAESVRADAEALPPPLPALNSPPKPPRVPFMGVALWWILCLLALGKLALSHHRARTHGLALHFLLPVPRLWGRNALANTQPKASQLLPRMGLVLGCTGLGLTVLQYHDSGSIACGALLMALVLERRCGTRAIPDQLAARTATAEEEARLARRQWLEHLDLNSLLDVTTLPGLLLFSSLVVLGLRALPLQPTPAPMLTFLLLGGLPFCSGTRRMQRPTVASQLRTLTRLRQELGPHHPSQLLLYSKALGKPVLDVRLSLQLATPATGLCQASLVVGEHRWLDRRIATPCWMLIVEQNSAAAAQAGRALPGVTPVASPDGQRLAYLTVASQVAQEASSLSGWLQAPGSQTALPGKGSPRADAA